MGPRHITYFILIGILVYLPHPFPVVGSYIAIIGFFFDGAGGIFIYILIITMGVLETFYLGRLIRGRQDFAFEWWLREYEKQFIRFRAAIELEPEKLLFLFQF